MAAASSTSLLGTRADDTRLRRCAMPTQGSREYAKDHARIRRTLEEHGVADEVAMERADDATETGKTGS
jgi:hypothetical protein